MNFENPDLQTLFNLLFSMCKMLLEKQGSFLPIGAIVTLDGKPGHVAANTKEEQPGGQKALELLQDGLRTMEAKGMCRATGVAIDTRLKAAPNISDIGKSAIWMILEEKSGKTQSVFVPYTKPWLRPFRYSEAFTLQGEPSIFRKQN